jgi:ferredoxin
MTFRKSIFLLTALMTIAALVACGGSSHTTTTTVPPTISIAFSGNAPTSLATGAQTSLTAVVSNDSANGGVNWTVTCGSAGACGSFSPVATASNAATMYTAPAAVPTGSTVTVTATAVDSSSATVSATITITAPPAISVALSPAPPTSLQISNTTPLVAVVTNDSQNQGVIWSVTCGSTGACGAFSAVTATTATYTAPAAVPTGSTVTVTATSKTDPTKSASATITITTTAPVISVAFNPAPPTSLQTSTAASLTAVVTNDSQNQGVNWTVTCGSAGACGVFSPTATLSNVATTYTAPAAVPTGSTVTVTATSKTDPSKSASAAITIAPPPLADGNYVFSLQGEDVATLAPYSLAGVFTVSGGVITTGEQDFVDFNGPLSDQINGTGSAMSTTADGNLQIVLTTCNGTDCTTADPNVGVSGVETLNGTLFCTCTALITEYDASAAASGTLDLQYTTTAPTGGFAFGVAGLDSNGYPLAIGGVLDINGPGTISGTGSVFDINDGGLPAPLLDQTFYGSTVSTPDPSGRLTFTLNPSTPSGIPQIILVGYIVDGSHIRLVETDDVLAGSTGGVALGQGTNTGTFGSIAGNSYVVGLSGFDTSGVLQAAGELIANSGGTVGGIINYNDLTGTGTQSPSAITGGTYTVDATGRVTMTGVTDGTATYNLQLYLTGAGQILSASMDMTDVVGGLGFGQTGRGSFVAGNFGGTYVVAAGGVNTPIANENEFGAVGPVVADGVGTFAGTADLNWISTGTSAVQSPDLTVSGAFTADPSGVFTGTIKGLDVTTTTNQDAFSYYLVDVGVPPSTSTTTVIAIETDANQLTLGYFDLETF